MTCSWFLYAVPQSIARAGASADVGLLCRDRPDELERTPQGKAPLVIRRPGVDRAAAV